MAVFFLLALIASVSGQGLPPPVLTYDLGSGAFDALQGNGAPALIDVGAERCNDAQGFVQDSEMGTVLRFKKGRGVYIPNIKDYLSSDASTEYTVRLTIKLDEVSGWRRMLNMRHGYDHGFYVNGCLNWYPDGCGTDSTLRPQANTWHTITVSSNALGGNRGNSWAYLDGNRMTRWEPKNSWQYGSAVVSNEMLFFNDYNPNTCNNGGEHTAGYLKGIQVFDTALAPAAVASLEGMALGALGDPHLGLPHGGHADFRGEPNAIYNFLSARGLSLNVMTELADFELHPANHSRHKHIHGSFLTQAHIVARTNAGKMVRVSFWADAIGPRNLAFANGTVDDEPAFKLGFHMQKTVDDVAIKMDYSSMRVLTPEFEIVVTPNLFRLERNVVGLHHRLDVKIKPRVVEAAFAVPPHGIIGQGWDGDGKAVDGEQDVFPESGEFTTYAMAKGAIEGVPNDYKVAKPYATDFKYSRFDATSGVPRNVANLVAAGALNVPKTVYLDGGGDAVGSTEVTGKHM